MFFLLGAARFLAGLGYFGLALRFLAVTAAQSDARAVFLLLAGGAAAAGLWNPQAAFRAIVLLFPIVFGLGRMNMLAIGSPEAVVFASLSVAVILRSAWQRTRRPAPKEKQPCTKLEFGLLALADLLAAWTLLSLFSWIHGRLGEAAFRLAFLSQPIFGVSDPLFPVTDTLIWLMGWFLLRQLIADSGGETEGPAGVSTPPGARDDWLCLCLLSWAACTAVFFVVQDGLKLVDGFSYDAKFNVPTSMFNDPHTFGGVSAALAVALLAWRRGKASPARIFSAIGAGVMLLFVFICYSRAAWFAAVAAIGLFLAIRHRRLAVGFAVLLAAALGLVAWRADSLLALDKPYLTRLVYLVRLDRLSDYHEARFSMYRRVPEMISARPLLGHGPGSSRITSIPFVTAADPTGPDFIHNTVLQAAVEQGVPAGIFLAALLVLALASAAWRWHLVRMDSIATAACLASIAFLLTQLTSNSLNVYLDQQFFFWTLTALLVVRLRLHRSATLVETIHHD